MKTATATLPSAKLLQRATSQLCGTSSGLTPMRSIGRTSIARRLSLCNTALHFAANFGRVEVLSALAAAGADVEKEGERPLHLAARNGHAGAVARLLELGAMVAPRDFEGDTPLHDAAEYGHVEVAKLLAAAKAPLDSRNRQGRGPRWEDLGWICETPLDVAKRREKSDVAELLQAKGRDGLQGF
eukprot:Skav225970  [mRNA]  locus=scaffold4916:21927:23667:- [translate_table: standard]